MSQKVATAELGPYFFFPPQRGDDIWMLWKVQCVSKSLSTTGCTFQAERTYQAHGQGVGVGGPSSRHNYKRKHALQRERERDFGGKVEAAEQEKSISELQYQGNRSHQLGRIKLTVSCLHQQTQTISCTSHLLMYKIKYSAFWHDITDFTPLGTYTLENNNKQTLALTHTKKWIKYQYGGGQRKFWGLGMEWSTGEEHS